MSGRTQPLVTSTPTTRPLTYARRRRATHRRGIGRPGQKTIDTIFAECNGGVARTATALGTGLTDAAVEKHSKSVGGGEEWARSGRDSAKSSTTWTPNHTDWDAFRVTAGAGGGEGPRGVKPPRLETDPSQHISRSWNGR